MIAVWLKVGLSIVTVAIWTRAVMRSWDKNPTACVIYTVLAALSIIFLVVRLGRLGL